MFKWNLLGNASKQEICNLHASVAVLSLASNKGTHCSSTAWVSSNTHRSGLLRHAASLARTPGVPRPRAVDTATVGVTRKSSVACIRARRTTATGISCDDNLLILPSSTTWPRTTTVWIPVVRTVSFYTRSSASCGAPIRLSGEIHQGRQTDRDNKENQKYLPHNFEQGAKGEGSK